jgi:DNA polymerase III epsilon subunit-like protein
MSKSRKICVVYTDTTGLHSCNEDVSKKNLYSFARLVCLNYEIGYRENKKFISTKKVKVYVKPRCAYIPEEATKIHGITMEIANGGNEIETILDNFVKDLSDVSIIICHNANFHLKTIMAEFVRYNKQFSFSNYIIIDTSSFFHELSFPKLDELYDNLIKKKSKTVISNTEKIRSCFLKLYENYENSIN